jgi:hypothetical protein
MSTTLSVLRNLDTQLNTLDTRTHARESLEKIQVKETRGGSGCIVHYEKQASFLTHWYNDAAQMTACLVHMKGLLKQKRTERDLYDFAESIFDQAAPSQSTVIWLYFINLTKLFTNIQDLKSDEFLKLLFAGIKRAKSKDTVEEVEKGSSLIVYEHFEVDIIPIRDSPTNYDAMIYFGLKGERNGIEYMESNGNATSPILLYNFNPRPHYIFSPAWRRKGLGGLKWIEPARAELTDFISKECFQNTLSLFKPNTPYEVIGETFQMHTQLYPDTTSDYELNIRNEDGMQKVFSFNTNPLDYAIDRPNFVCALTKVGFQHWQYTPTRTEAGMECSVALRYMRVDDGEDAEEYLYLQDALGAFDLSLNVSYKGVTTGDDFIIIRSTKTEEEFSDADSEPETH